MKVCPTPLSVLRPSLDVASSLPKIPDARPASSIPLWLWARFCSDALWFLYYSCFQFVALFLWLGLFMCFAFHCLQFFFCTRHGLAWIVNSPAFTLCWNMKSSQKCLDYKISGLPWNISNRNICRTCNRNKKPVNKKIFFLFLLSIKFVKILYSCLI